MATVKHLSKIDFHRHIEGSLSPETIFELYKRNSKGNKTVDDFKKLLVLDKGVGSLDKFIKKLGTKYLKEYVRNSDDLCFAFEKSILEAKKDNVDYLELRFTISNFLAIDDKPENLIQKIKEQMDKTFEENKMEGGLILGLKRDDGLDLDLKLADLLINLYKSNHILGVDLAGNEHFFPNEMFEELGQKLKKHEIPFIVHAGEVTSAQSVALAVEKLGAKRISHGVKAAEDERVMELLAKKEILLEVCPTSNIQTGAYKDYSSVPIRTLLDHNVPILICTDDPVTSGITLTSEVDNLINRGIITLGEYKKMLKEAERHKLLPVVGQF